MLKVLTFIFFYIVFIYLLKVVYIEELINTFFIQFTQLYNINTFKYNRLNDLQYISVLPFEYDMYIDYYSCFYSSSVNTLIYTLFMYILITSILKYIVYELYIYIIPCLYKIEIISIIICLILLYILMLFAYILLASST